MDAPRQVELQRLQAVAGPGPAADSVVHWRSAYGLIVIETRGDQVFVNGDLVEPLNYGREGRGA